MREACVNAPLSAAQEECSADWPTVERPSHQRWAK